MVPPPVVHSWAEGCRRSRRGRLTRAPGQQPAAQILARHNDSSALAATLNAILVSVAKRLAQRGVLCSASVQCAVSYEAGGYVVASRLKVCLPEVARRALLCEPWGEPWQQQGIPVGGFSTTGCVKFNIIDIARWWQAIRSYPPYLGKSDRRLRQLLSSKPSTPCSGGDGCREMSGDGLPKPMGARAALMGAQQVEHAAAEMEPLLERGGSLSSPARAIATPRYERCAVVGSGHDLLCYQPSRGREIDAADAVWRANAAQHAQLSHASLLPLARGEGPQLGRGRALELLGGHSGSVALAGGRTTHRVNCLFEAYGVRSASTPPAACVVGHAWFKQPWRGEHFSNTRHPCCERRRTANYSVSRLLELRSRGVEVRLLQGGGLRAASFERKDAVRWRRWRRPDEAREKLWDSSGGNALHGAVASCGHVKLYGAGLYSESPAEPKRYFHFYDDHVTTCVDDPWSKSVKGRLERDRWQVALGNRSRPTAFAKSVQKVSTSAHAA